jgi:uncharacterized protein (TIGR02594 family)
MTPAWLTLAHKEMGVEEVAGAASNPRIMTYFACAPHSEWVQGDDVPWCGAFATFLMSQSGLPLPPEPLRARSWLAWGEPLSEPAPGCVVILKRGTDPKQGHVTFYVQSGDDGKSLYCLGGNQGDRVCIAKYRAADVLGYRWPPGQAKPGVTVSAITKASRIAKEGKELVAAGGATVAVATADKAGGIPKPPAEVLASKEAIGDWQMLTTAAGDFMRFAVDHWMLVAGIAIVVAGVRIIRWRKQDADSGKTWAV